MIIGMDLSKRSSALVCLDMEGGLVDFTLINPPKEIDGEDLFAYQWGVVNSFVSDWECSLEGIAIEGLSYNSVGSGKDILYGLHWVIRVLLFMDYPKIPVGIIPPQSWFSKVVTKEERKAIVGVKDGRKKIVVDKLPFEVKARFEEYIREKGVKKEALYDLSDAWHISKYRLSLE